MQAIKVKQEAGWAPEPVWTQKGRENPYTCQKSNTSHPSCSLVSHSAQVRRKNVVTYSAKSCKDIVVPALQLSTMPEGILGEWKYSSTHSLTSALNGGEGSASHPSCFTLRERAPGTHWIGGWVGPRVVLDAVVKRKIPSPRGESNPRTPLYTKNFVTNPMQ
jgi:hypothetical protein